jgi:hypothetical protein
MTEISTSPLFALFTCCWMSFEAVLGNKEFELVVLGVTYFTQIIFSLFLQYLSFVVILPHHKNVLLLAFPLVQYDCYSITEPPN